MSKRMKYWLTIGILALIGGPMLFFGYGLYFSAAQYHQEFSLLGMAILIGGLISPFISSGISRYITKSVIDAIAAFIITFILEIIIGVLAIFITSPH